MTIRAAERPDAAQIAHVHDEAWREAYRGIIPGPALERMVQRRGPAWWSRLLARQSGVLVLEVGGQVAGYATMGANRSSSLRVRGEIYELYVTPIYQGLGFGERLFDAAKQRLAENGLRPFIVWVLEDNDRAVAFYEAIGGEPVARGEERFDDRSCRKLAYAWGVSSGRMN
ncbi:MAG: N-acetyltransferase [Pseudomonadota bacterium]